jgi:hypothetical protein
MHPTALGPSPLGSLIKEGEKTGVATEILFIDKQAYQIVLVPVLAPDPIAWVAMGFLVNNHLAQQLRDVTNLHVSFLLKSPDNTWRLLASTQTLESSQLILNASQQSVNSSNQLSEPITIDDYATLLSVLQQKEDFSIYTVLQRSELEAIQSLKHLRTIFSRTRLNESGVIFTKWQLYC